MPNSHCILENSFKYHLVSHSKQAKDATLDQFPMSLKQIPLYSNAYYSRLLLLLLSFFLLFFVSLFSFYFFVLCVRVRVCRCKSACVNDFSHFDLPYVIVGFSLYRFRISYTQYIYTHSYHTCTCAHTRTHAHIL